MTLNGLITIISISIAAYAIMSEASRLRLKMKLRHPVVFTCLALLFVLYLQFFDYVGLAYFDFLPEKLREFFTLSDGLKSAQGLSFLMVLFWMLGMAAFVSKKKVSIRDTPQLSRVISDLINRGKFQEACSLLSQQRDLFEKITKGDYIPYAIHKRLSRFTTLDYLIGRASQSNVKPNIVQRKIFPHLAKLFPSGDVQVDAVRHILADVHNSSGMIEALTTSDISLGLSMMAVDTYGSREYEEKFLREIFGSRNQAFFRELRDGNAEYNGHHYNAERTPILAALFNDAALAEQRSIWKPIGDYVLETLRGQNDIDYIAFLNSPCVDERPIFSNDITYYGLLYFNHMVHAAAHADVPYHMWLFYLRDFAKYLVDGYDTSDPMVDTNAEHPINASYLIWQVLSTLSDWTTLRRKVSRSLHHEFVDKPDSSNENSNIPKSAAICLAHCFETIITSNKVDENFKVYCTEIVMRVLSQCEEGFFRQAFVCCLLGENGYGDKAQYLSKLDCLLAKIDHVIRFSIEDLTEALEQKITLKAP